MTTTPGSGTPIYDALVELLLAGEPHSQPGAHSKPAGSTCTPVEWFGPPVHARHTDTTAVIPAVMDEPEAKAS